MPNTSPTTKTYLVEHYQPGLDGEGLQAYADRVRAATVAVRHEGLAVQNPLCTILPSDETLLCLFEADSERTVRVVYDRAALRFDRISEAIGVDNHIPPIHLNSKEERR